MFQYKFDLFKRTLRAHIEESSEFIGAVFEKLFRINIYDRFFGIYVAGFE